MAATIHFFRRSCIVLARAGRPAESPLASSAHAVFAGRPVAPGCAAFSAIVESRRGGRSTADAEPSGRITREV